MDITADLAAVTARIAEIAQRIDPAPAPPASSFSDALASAMNTSDAPAQTAVAQESGSQVPAIVPPAQIERLVDANAGTWQVDPALVKAIIANESGFDANATSRTGAQGLMQLEPGTAAGLGVTNAYDPIQNVWAGTRYIRGLLDRFHGDVQLAVAAYNAGPQAVEKYGGVPPYAETQSYVQNVLQSYRRYKAQ